MTIIQQLKEVNPTLYQINEFIISAGKLGYGEIVLTVKAHDYVARVIDMQAIKPKGKTIAKSITKRVMIKEKKLDTSKSK